MTAPSPSENLAEISGQRIRELIAPLGFGGAKMIVDDYLREVRPMFRPRRFLRAGSADHQTTAQAAQISTGADGPVSPGADNDRRETRPQSKPQEVHCHADAVRSVPRV
jgi:hypothetical protein